ncbi:MAG: RimK family protein [Spirochaetota bacterium]
MQSIIVTNKPKDEIFVIPGVKTVSAKDYLVSSDYSGVSNLTVLNLCRSYAYQTDGYYVSLLAAAREHTAFPAVRTIQEIKSPSIIRIITEDIYDLIQKKLHSITADKFSFNIYFGKSKDKEYETLAREIFHQFPSPFLRADFSKKKKEWRLHNISHFSSHDIPSDDLAFALSCADNYCSSPGKKHRRKTPRSYDLAILFDEEEKVPPSDKKAIERFESAAHKIGFNTEIITKDDYSRIPEFDALFIRETTNVNHHTFRFSQRAELDGLVVIDDPLSILRCTNKVYLAERLNHHGIPAPKTVIINKENRSTAIRSLGYPIILKEPDGSFSQGVKKAVNREDFRQKTDDLFEASDLIIAQEFVPTEFDWRIGIIDNKIIYACRYYMAKEHWQIVNWQGKGGVRVGKWDCVPLPEVPSVVLKTALRAAKVIGSSLYGVDLKLIGKKCYVIEVNDNPSIETGVEDLILKDELYMTIMRTMYERVRIKKEETAGYLPNRKT